MRRLDVSLVYHRVPESRVNLLVPEQDLYLLYWHALIDCSRGKRPSKLVRMDPADTERSAKFPKHRLHAADLESVMRRAT